MPTFSKLMRRAALVLALVAALLVVGGTEPAASPPSIAVAADTAPVEDIWVFGDSITAGTWLGPGEGWADQLDTALGGRVRNFGIGGQAIAFSAPGLPRMDDTIKQALIYQSPKPTTIILAGGINDFIQSDESASTTRWAVFNLSSYLAANYPTIKFYVMTTTPYRSDAGYATTLSVRRANYNDWARAQFGPSGTLIDSGDLLTAGATYADITYYLDHLHPNAKGAAILETGVQNALHTRGIG